MDSKTPKPHSCNIRTRLEILVYCTKFVINQKIKQ